MFCKKCGKELKNNTLFCTNCGQKVLMPVSPVWTGEIEATKSVEDMSVIKLAGKLESIVNLVLVIAAGIAMVVIAVVGYFLWFERSDAPSVEEEAVEMTEDSMADDVREPLFSEDEEYSVQVESAQELEKTEPVEESEEELGEVSQYFLPTSSSEYLTISDLEGFSQDDCRMARNELYARHGRRFDDPNLQAYFDALEWYEGTIEPEDFDGSVMNEYEIANRDLIVQYEKDMGYR